MKILKTEVKHLDLCFFKSLSLSAIDTSRYPLCLACNYLAELDFFMTFVCIQFLTTPGNCKFAIKLGFWDEQQQIVAGRLTSYLPATVLGVKASWGCTLKKSAWRLHRSKRKSHIAMLSRSLIFSLYFSEILTEALCFSVDPYIRWVYESFNGFQVKILLGYCLAKDRYEWAQTTSWTNVLSKLTLVLYVPKRFPPKSTFLL